MATFSLTIIIAQFRDACTGGQVERGQIFNEGMKIDFHVSNHPSSSSSPLFEPTRSDMCVKFQFVISTRDRKFQIYQFLFSFFFFFFFLLFDLLSPLSTDDISPSDLRLIRFEGRPVVGKFSFRYDVILNDFFRRETT